MEQASSSDDERGLLGSDSPSRDQSGQRAARLELNCMLKWPFKRSLFLPCLPQAWLKVFPGGFTPFHACAMSVDVVEVVSPSAVAIDSAADSPQFLQVPACVTNCSDHVRQAHRAFTKLFCVCVPACTRMPHQQTTKPTVTPKDSRLCLPIICPSTRGYHAVHSMWASRASSVSCRVAAASNRFQDVFLRPPKSHIVASRL